MRPVISNRYRIDAIIGAGGMGTVHRGIDLQTRQPVAIKQLKPEVSKPEFIERFRREGEALRQLNHPNIVKLIDTVEASGIHYLILEYVSGGDLYDMLKKDRPDIRRILRLAIDLADALTRAHKLNIIHRDLKPTNVLIAGDGTLRLTDFGIAYFADRQRITAADNIVGTLDYLAPEVLRGETIDSRADIWAFGVMLFEMLARQRPFGGHIAAQTLFAILTEPVPDLEALCPEAPMALVDLIYRMLERDPSSRVASVRIVGAELEAILEGRSPPAQPLARIAGQDSDIPTRPVHRLPVQPTPFVGREDELAELAKFINDIEIRLITIIAPGGMGKTRLSLQAGEQQARHFPDGVFFVELAPLNDADSIPSAIGGAAGYPFQPDLRDQKQQVLDFLAPKHLLLILDNFEHLLAGASLVSEILQAASKVKIIVTSRQRLNQPGEILLHLAGMDFPEWETPDDASGYTAVKLFMNSARRARPDFELTPDRLRQVARICRLVQGMPLGIVLAASWLALLSPKEIADEIARSFDFLAAEASELPERQRSLRAVFDYSWQMITAAEQQVFMKLAIFRGGFSREAAEDIAGATLRILLSLVNKSLIRRDIDSGQYSIHDLLRQYAEDKLRESGLYADIATRHAAYYARLVSQMTVSVDLPDESSLTAIAAAFDNIRAAWDRAQHTRAYDLLHQMQSRLYTYWYLRGRWQEGIELFDAVWRDLPGNIEQQDTLTIELFARLAEDLGFIHFMRGHYSKVRTYLIPGLELAEKLNHQTLVSSMTRHLGTVERLTGSLETAIMYYDRSRTAAQAAGNDRMQVMSMQAKAAALRHQGHYHQSRELYQETIRLARDVNFMTGELTAMSGLGILAYLEGQYVEAHDLHLQILEKDRVAGNSWGTANDLAYLACIAVARGDFAGAAQWIAEGLALALRMQTYPLILKHLVSAALWHLHRGGLDEAIQIGRQVIHHESYNAEVKELVGALKTGLDSVPDSPGSQALDEPPGDTPVETLVEELLDKFNRDTTAHNQLQ